MKGPRLKTILALAATSFFVGLSGAASGQSTAGTVTVLSAPERPFRSLQLAVDSARDGDVLRLGPGLYEEPVRIAGKSLRLVGAGAGASTLRGPGAMLTVAADARVRVEGLSFVGQAREGAGTEALSAVYVEGDGFWMSECEVSGFGGFAVEIADAHEDVEIFGSFLHSNGAGVRLERAGGRLEGNVIANNAGPALVLGEPPAHDAPVVVEHNTLVGNGGATVASGLDASARQGAGERVSFGYNILTGELPIDLLVRLSRDTFDYANLRLESADIAGFFEDAEEGDYRPRKLQKKDAVGLEFGGRLSEDGAAELRPTVERALGEGRLREGLALVRWIAPADREAYLNRGRSTLYARFVENLEAGRFGLALRDFFVVSALAPPEWGIADRFRVAFRRMLAPYETRLDWSAAFPAGSELAAALARLVESGQAATGRPGTEAPGAPQWTVRGRVEAPLDVKRVRRGVEAVLRAPNPDYRAVQQTLVIEQRRREAADAARRKDAEMLEVARAQGHAPNSAFVRARAAKVDRAVQRLVEIEQGIRALETTRDSLKASFAFTLSGQREEVHATARALVELSGPSGESRPLSVALDHREHFVRMKPLPALDWPGAPGRVADEASERDRYAGMMARNLVAAVLNTVEKRDLDRVVALLGAANTRRATDADFSELFELVALYAPRIEAATRALREQRRLEARLATLPERDEPEFRLVEDRSLERSPPLAVVADLGLEREQTLSRLAEIQHRYALYLGVVEQLDGFFTKAGGGALDDFLQMARAAR